VHNHFETTFGRGELFALAATLASVHTDNILSRNLNYRTGNDYADAETGGFVRSPAPGEFSGAVLLPLSATGDVSDWSQIRTFASLLFGNRDAYFRSPLLALDTADAKPLHARRLKNELIRYGFRIEEIKRDKDEEPEIESTVGVTAKGDKESAALLSELLALPVIRSHDEPESATGATIRITLGKDYAFKNFAKVWEIAVIEQ
jgi:hypothetical protein